MTWTELADLFDQHPVDDRRTDHFLRVALRKLAAEEEARQPVSIPEGAAGSPAGDMYVPCPEPDRPYEFRRDLATVINKHSAENGSNTPDFILGDFLADVLNAFDLATHRRAEWYSKAPQPDDRDERIKRLSVSENDIVKRLRAVDHMSVEDCFLQSHLFATAAVEIESLRAQLAKDTERERLIGAFMEAYKARVPWGALGVRHPQVWKACNDLFAYERSKGRG